MLLCQSWGKESKLRGNIMRKFLRILLAVLLCTSAMCVTDVFASTATSDKVQKSDENQIHDSIQDVKSTAVNNAFNTYSDEEVYLVAQLIYHEAHNQAYNGKVAIAEVVLNRVNSTAFPNKIEDVIFQSGQFTSSRRLKNINPTDQEVRIAFNVLNGSLRVLNDSDVLYFRNPKITNNISAKIEKNWGSKEYFTHIGDHAFYSQDTGAGSVLTKDNGNSIFGSIPSSISLSGLFGKKTTVASAETKDIEVVKESQVTDNVLKVEEGTESEITDAAVSEEQQLLALALQNVETGITDANEEMDALEGEESEELLVVDNAIMMAQANQILLTVEKNKVEKSAVEEELDDFDENDPVAIARRQAILDQKAEVERIARENEQQARYNELAQEHAKELDQMQVERIAKINEETAKATQAAVDAAKRLEALQK